MLSAERIDRADLLESTGSGRARKMKNLPAPIRLAHNAGPKMEAVRTLLHRGLKHRLTHVLQRRIF